MRAVELERRPLSLTARVFLCTALVVLSVATTVLLAVAGASRKSADETARRGLEQSADLVAQFLAGRERTLVGGARVFVQTPYFRTFVAGRRRDDVFDRALEAVEQIGADWVFITDANGVLIAKSDEPGVTDVPMGQVPLIAGALRGQETSGFGASGDTLLFQAVALPIRTQLGGPIGVLVATRVVDSVFLHAVKASSASDLLFYSRDEAGRSHAVASTLMEPADSLARFLAPRVGAATNAEQVVTLRKIQYLARGTALNTAGGKAVGGFHVIRARGAASATFAALRTPIVVALFVGSLVTLLATFLTSRFITRPARALADAVGRVSRGDNSGAATLFGGAGGVPELRQLATAFHTLATDLRDKEALISVARLPHDETGATRAAAVTEIPRSSRAVGLRSSPMAVPALRRIAHPGLVLSAGAILSSRYLIESEVGRGGLGIVYKALDRVLNETVAIKVLRPDLVMADAAAFEQLKRELRITRRLSHRNIVRTYDIGDADSAPFLTMEFVDGASLASVIHARGSLSRGAVLAVAKQLLGALAIAHDLEIIHGDLKPQNLLIDANGLLKVTDFGLARVVRGARPSRAPSGDGVSAPESHLFRLSGAVLGTPEYMAPEQLIGEASSIQTDIYAAGVVLQECLTGSTPYQADTPVAFVARKLGSDVAASRSASDGIDVRSQPDIAAIVERMTDPHADLRPRSARMLMAQVSELM